MPSIACVVCGASAPTLSYYQCEECGGVHCEHCGKTPIKKGSGFLLSAFGFLAEIFGDSRCAACFDQETGEGGDSRLAFRPPTET